MPAEPTIMFLGQAGFVFETTAGTRVAVDPYLSDCVERVDGFKRLCPKVMDPAEAGLDFVVATHWHWDHYDVDAVPQLMGSGSAFLLAASDCREQAKDIPDDRKRFLSDGDVCEAADVLVRAVFCDHGDAAPLAIGLVLEFDGRKVYIAGDTCLRLDKAPEVAQHGPFDVMIAPINGAFGNLSEIDAARLCQAHGPRVFIPSHYWMFAEHHGDPGLFKDVAGKMIPDQAVYCMRPGEVVPIGELVA